MDVGAGTSGSCLSPVQVAKLFLMLQVYFCKKLGFDVKRSPRACHQRRRHLVAMPFGFLASIIGVSIGVASELMAAGLILRKVFAAGWIFSLIPSPELHRV